jgi:hypothetical protein
VIAVRYDDTGFGAFTKTTYSYCNARETGGPYTKRQWIQRNSKLQTAKVFGKLIFSTLAKLTRKKTTTTTVFLV